MPKNNFWIVVFAILAYFFFATHTSVNERILLTSLRHIEKRSLVAPSEEFLMFGALNGMLGSLIELGDEYSEFIPPHKHAAFEEMMTMSFQGVGFLFHPLAEKGNIRILFPLANSPAENAGIQPNDIIVGIDGHSVTELEFAQAARKIRGIAGTTVNLEISRNFDGQETLITIPIKRAEIRQSSIFGETRFENGEPNYLLETEPDIAYISISQFTENTFFELNNVISALPKHVRGLILDLRGNPGGILDVSVDVANIFLSPKAELHDVVTTRFRDGSIKERFPVTQRVEFTLPMIVLIDGESASAAEIVAAALQDFGRAVIVGSRSYGKGTVQEIVEIPMSAGSLKLTTSAYWRPSEKNIQKSLGMTEDDIWGVKPDVEGEIILEQPHASIARFIRRLRSNIKANILPTIVQKFTNEELGETLAKLAPEQSEIPILQGNAPYYDPQLDRAIFLLRKML